MLDSEGVSLCFWGFLYSQQDTTRLHRYHLDVVLLLIVDELGKWMKVHSHVSGCYQIR